MRKETNERNVELGTEKREQKLVTDFLRSVVYSGMKGRGGGVEAMGEGGTYGETRKAQMEAKIKAGVP